MTSREIVRRTLDFEGPERVARSFADEDFAHCHHNAQTYATEWRQVGSSRWEHVDAWGNTWARVDPTSKGEVAKGVLETLDDAERYELPRLDEPSAYAHIKEIRDEHPDMWLIGSLPGFAFNIARKLRRLDQYLLDILIDSERIHALHSRIDALLGGMIRSYADGGVDAVMFCEDWGSQSQLMIDPALWREEFFPRYAKLCGVAHGCGVRVFMHSCGQIEAIVPWLMEAGIDLLQFDQPELHGLDTLAAHHERGKITFWCPVDIQKTLQTRDEGRIRERAREMLDKLWRGRGGFVAGYYGDNASIGLDPRWQAYACEEFLRCGVSERYTADAERPDRG